MLCFFVSLIRLPRALAERIVREDKLIEVFSDAIDRWQFGRHPRQSFLCAVRAISKPIKSPQKAFRTYQLSFQNGEPVFTLSDIDRILEEAFEEIFGSGTNE